MSYRLPLPELCLANILPLVLVLLFFDIEPCLSRSLPSLKHRSLESRLPLSVAKSLGSTTTTTNLVEQLVNGTSQPLNETKNGFQSSLTCGQSEFYVQLDFYKPFRGVVYAYHTPTPSEDVPQPLSYPVPLMDTCALHGNGGTMIYMQLSFASECVEKMSSLAKANAPGSTSEEVLSSTPTEGLHYHPVIVSSETNSSPPPLEPINDAAIHSVDIANQLPKYSLDGFNFRRALNDAAVINADDAAMLHGQKHNENGTLQSYQLSLFIQNDPLIEQKADSKVTIQCSTVNTKNVIYEQNPNQKKMNSTSSSRRVDQPQQQPRLPSSPSGRLIVPTAHLTVLERKLANATLSQKLPSEDVTELMDSRIDILRGNLPHLKLIETPVGIGDDVTLIIRAKELDGLDTKVSTCYAHDEDNTKRFILTDQEGCPLEPTIMSEFGVLHNLHSGTKVYHATISAFKFPNSAQLHIDCTLLTCRGLCPKVSCETSQRARPLDGH